MMRSFVSTASRQLRSRSTSSRTPLASLTPSIVASPRRSFHSFPWLHGWNQHVAFGVGLPLKIEDVARVETATKPAGRITRVVVNECMKQLRVEVPSGGLMLDADRCSKWVQHDSLKHGRVLVCDRNLHWIEEYQFVLPADELIGPFDSFEKLAEAIGLHPEEAADVWTHYKTEAMGSMHFEEHLGLSRPDEERCRYPYAWWAAAANVWAD